MALYDALEWKNWDEMAKLHELLPYSSYLTDLFPSTTNLLTNVLYMPLFVLNILLWLFIYLEMKMRI